MLQSLSALLRHDRGFDPHNVLTFDVNLPDSSYPNDKDRSRQQFQRRQIRSRIPRASCATLPASSMSPRPPSFPRPATVPRFASSSKAAPHRSATKTNAISPEVSRDYFSTLKISLARRPLLLRGRRQAKRRAQSSSSAEPSRRAYFPGESAVNKRIRYTYNPKQPYPPHRRRRRRHRFGRSRPAASCRHLRTQRTAAATPI